MEHKIATISTRLFDENWFFKNYFLIFLYLFIIRKVGQQKTLSSQRKI
jgi:hypothetical protein